MPKMDGIQMMNTLRALGCKAHVIVLTAYSDFEYAHSALRFGADDYLLKPFKDSELESVILGAFKRVGGAAEDAEKKLAPIDPSGKSRYVQEALRFIVAHYAEDISITAVAAFLSMSEGLLSHLFKKETGTTVMAYLTRYRIHAAMLLLRDCRVKIYEAAEKVGYRDVTYFGSTFKKWTGLSPSEYQNSVTG
jgi:two-component system response regulator YesN